MNSKAIIIALFQIGGGLILGLIILFSCFKIIRFLAKKRYKIEDFNTSFALVTGSILFAVGYFMTSIIEPIITTFRQLIKQEPALGTVILKGAGYMLLYFGITTLLSFIVILISYLLFTLFTTNINEAREIKNNNIAIGIILGVVIIVMALLVKDGVVMLTDSLIPFPALPKSIG